jgi:hypothetical protein
VVHADEEDLMALRVPTVTGPSVDQRPLTTPFQRSSVSPAMLQNPHLEQAGRALLETGVAMQEREDADTLMRAETEVKARYAEWAGEAKQRKGQQAWGVAKEAGEFWDKESERVSKTITSPRAKALFEREVMRHRGMAVGDFSGFEAGQRRASLDESAQASIVGSINLAAANPGNAEILSAAKGDIIKRNQLRAKLNGWDPVVAEAKEAEYLTNFHKQVIQGLVRTAPEAAEAYFEANKAEIEGSQHTEVGAFAARATATRVGDTTADSIWQSLGPKSDRDAVSLDVMEQALRKQLAGKDEAIKAGIAGLRERTQAFKDGRRERGEQLEAEVNAAILRGAGAREIRSMPAFLQLPPEQARKIADFMESRALRHEQIAATRESRADAAEAREQRRLQRRGYAAYLQYSSPATLAGMSERQVLNLLPELGNDLTGNLMEKKRQLAKEPKLAEAKMDEDDFNHIARQMKLPVDKSSKNEDEKALIGEVKYRVEQMITAAQADGKRTLTRDEKLQLVRREIARTVTVGGFFSDTEVPVIALTQKQLEKVEIPSEDRRRLADAMRQMYERTQSPLYAPTADNLKRFYLLRKSPAGELVLPRE